MPDIPRIRWPFGRAPNGKLAVVEQDSPEHVASCEWAIIRCPVGFRQERPDFGWRWPTFADFPIDLSGLEEALKRFEPRSTASVSQRLDDLDPSIVHLTVLSEVPSSG